MRAEIISIGTELLLGSLLNTNARFLSQKLAENAVNVYRQTTVGDNIDRIVACFGSATNKAQVVIASGGLGPTEDDVTVQSLSKFLKKPLVFHRPTYQKILKRLEKRQLPMTRLIAKQCYVPSGALIFPNVHGTAPGIFCQHGDKTQKKCFLLLPGPPRELEPMFEGQALPVLLRLMRIKKEHFVIRSIRIAGLIEAQVAQKTTDLLKLKPPLTVGIYADLSEVELKIMAKAHSKKVALKMADGIENKIRRRFKEKVFGIDDESLSFVVGRLLRNKKETLSIAESCTGGCLSKMITEVSGSSDYFAGAVVSYANEVKTDQLRIPSSLIKKEGAVSPGVAREMAQNVRKIFNTDYGISVTGIAGPSGGSRKKPVGLVYIAIASRRGVFCVKNQFLSSRLEIQESASHKALDLLRLKLLR